MRRKLLPLLLLAIGISLIPVSAVARWYQVEIVAFRNNGSDDGERWGDLRSLPDFSRVVTLIRDQDLPEVEPSDRARAFRALQGSQMRLGGIARRLRRSDAYQTILHAGWRQPSYGVAGARRVYLSDLQISADPAATDGIATDTLSTRLLEGVVAIKISRLMHIEVDFLYYHEGSPVRLHETRKAKLREIHHFDHPLFGLIVQVSPYVLPSVPETTDVSADEPEDTSGAETNAVP